MKDKNAIAIINKDDLECNLDIAVLKDSFKHILFISAKNDSESEELSELIKNMFIDGNIKVENGELISNIRHRDCLIKARLFLENALNAAKAFATPDIISIDLQEALSALGEITGQTVSENIIKDIFSRFCVGK